MKKINKIIDSNLNKDFASVNKKIDYSHFDFDKKKNAGSRGEFIDLATKDSKVRVLVIPTNEELVIARETKEVVENLK